MYEGEPDYRPRTKTHDYVYSYHGYHTPGGICRIRVYEGQSAVPVVIATELPTNTNTSVTNMAEFLAAEIIAKHFPARFEEEQPVIWIEHYPPIEAYGKRGRTHTYSRVDFASYKPRLVSRFSGPRIRIGDPAWRRLTEDEVARIIGQQPT